MNWKDITNDSDQWTGLRIEVNGNNAPTFQLESGANCRFKLYKNEQPLLWGTFGSEYWGVWLLINKVSWEVSDMPVIPINASIIEQSNHSDYYKFWSRFFAKELSGGNPSALSNGLWTLTIGSPLKNRIVITSELINDIDTAFARNNPRWVEWDIGRCGSLVALKNEPSEDDGRVKWFRKLALEGTCPPVLIWYLNCIDGYIILDGHSRLKAFQLAAVPVKFLVLNSVIEKEVIRDPEIQKSILLGIEKRQKNQFKTKMNVDEVNKLLISVFDTRPFYRPITNAKAKRNYDVTWTSEVREFGLKTNVIPDELTDMIGRLDW